MPIEAGCPVPAPQLSGLYGARPLASPLEETVLDAAPVAIALVVGPEFRFVYANRTLEARGAPRPAAPPAPAPAPAGW